MTWGDYSDVSVIMWNQEKEEIGKYVFRVDKSTEENFLIRVSSQRAWFKKDVTSIVISVDGKVEITDVSIANEKQED